MISVQRFERWTTLPGFAVWFDLRLQASLKVIQPLPVSASVLSSCGRRDRGL